MEILVLFVVFILLSSFTLIPFIRFLQTRGNREKNSFLLVVEKFLVLSVIILIQKVFSCLVQENYFITTNLKICWL